MDDLGIGLRRSESGALIPYVRGEAERDATAAESRRRQRRDKDADRAVDAVAYAEHERAKREQLRRELPDHLKDTAA